jgi:hypothetical protein
MAKVLGGIIGIGIVLLLASAIAGQFDREPSYADYERERIELEALQHQADIDAFWLPVRAAALNTALIVGVFGVAVYLAALGVGQLSIFRSYARPDAMGTLPVLRSDQDAAHKALEGYHAAQLAEATRAIPPSHLVFSPHYSSHRSDSSGILTDSAVVEPAQLPGLTDLAQLGHTPTRNAILLGLGAGGRRITVSAPALCHVALVGSTGSGKSNLLRLLLPQLLAIGADVLLADPHHAPLDPESGDDWRPIVERLRQPVAITTGAGGQIDGVLSYLVEQLERRKVLRREGTQWGPPIFLALDELPVIAEGVPHSIERLARLLREGRKYSIYQIGASQSMLVKAIGGDSSARENYRTSFYVGGDLRSASALLDVPQRLIDESALGAGVAYLRSAATSPAQLIRVPYASNAAIAALLGQPEPSQQTSQPRPMGFRPVVARVAASVVGSGEPLQPHQDAEILTAEERSIIAAFLGGESVSDIAARLAGGKKGGHAYAQAAAVVSAALRKALGRKV